MCNSCLIRTVQTPQVVPAIMAYKRKVMVMQRCIRAFLIRQRETSAFNEAAWKVSLELSQIEGLAENSEMLCLDIVSTIILTGDGD